jgi:formylmethanofuran dehydrogenase subunit C
VTASFHHRLVQRAQPPLRIDARALVPAKLSALSALEVAKMPMPIGREHVALGDWFSVEAATGVPAEATPALTIEGDLSRMDNLGLGLEAGALHLHGSVGDGVGLGMKAGVIVVHGDAMDLAGCSLRGGTLEIKGNVGDLAASALPGDMDGMRGGTFVVHGNAGARLGDRMRRGTLVVHGDVGDFAASRMVAGTLALGGRCGAHPAYGMRRGSIVFAGPAPSSFSPSFVPVAANADVFWALLSRDLQRFGGAFAGLARRQITRMAGDLAVQGKGEWLLPR